MRFRTVQHFNEYQIPADSPIARMPQVAIAGRSNAGKSTLLNALVEDRRAARTSGRPGRTQEIHYFLIDNAWLLVDLPGYGYAKVSRDMRREWNKRMARYFEATPSLHFAVLIQDCRRDPGPDEQWILERANALNADAWIVANKIDQLAKPARKLRLAELFGMYKALGYPRRVLGASARDREGLEPLEKGLLDLSPPRDGAELS